MQDYKKYTPFLIATLVFLLINSNVNAQLYFQKNKTSSKEISVKNEAKQTLKFPWAGGLNAAQFGEIDLNLDGIKDLVVFERHGNRLMTFLNGGEPNAVDYSYAPEYIDAFPEIRAWAIFKDYNNDGLEDIFTYSYEYPGIVVYKNTSQNDLKFELEVYPYLTSYQGSGYVNILVTSVDYPGIEDIDNDGDMDILTFWGLGSFVEYHQNQSMELYGIPDSLTFIEVATCWGYFAENEESNELYLDTCYGRGLQSESVQFKPGSNSERHTGSTFLLLDLDADNDKDLLLGDVDFPKLVELINGGTADEAHMVSQNPDFPAYDVPLDIFSMPVAAYIDIDNNETKDLIVSSFDPNPITSENYTSVWAYLNKGQNNLPQFSLLKNNFLQDDMIDLGAGAYPVLADYNNDGLPDLFVSNFGYYMWSYYTSGYLLKSVYWSNIALFENTGTADEPEFTRITHDFANLHSLHLTGIYPSFADLDSDNDLDLIFGQEDGTLSFMKNIAGPEQFPVYTAPVLNYQNIDVGDFSTPQLFDLNMDGLFDLIIGEQAGNLNYYKNTGSQQNPSFEFVTDSLGKVNVTNFNESYDGYSTPCFFYSTAENIELIVGSNQGKLFYYKNITENQEGAFQENDSLFMRVGAATENYNHGIRTAAAIGQLTNDGFFDLMVGNYAGGLNFYQQVKNPPVANIAEQTINSLSIEVYPNPANGIVYFKNSDLRHEGQIHISIFNVASNRVYSKEQSFSGEMQIDISNFEPGIYFYHISFQKNNISCAGRFIKVK